MSSLVTRCTACGAHTARPESPTVDDTPASAPACRPDRPVIVSTPWVDENGRHPWQDRRPRGQRLQRAADDLAAEVRASGVGGEVVLALVRAALLRAG